MSKIQYVPDKESPFIKKLYGKEDNFKVEILTYFGTLYELEKLQNQIEVLEKALELAITDICVGRECKFCPYDNICDSWQGLHKEKAKDYFINKAKEIMKSE